MRALAANLAWVAVMLGLFFAALFYMVPSVQAATCAGQWIATSWYGKETCHGRPPGLGKGTCHTAAGIPFDGSQILVAHKTLPFGTRVRFTYHGKSIVLPVEDRGPYIKGREFDLSRSAAERIGLIHAGVGRVCAEQIR